MRTIGKDPLALMLFGGSAGSMSIFEEIVSMARSPLSCAVVFVLHRASTSRSLLPDLFRSRTNVTMREPGHLDPIETNSIYFACPDYHLLIGPDSRFYYDHSEKDFFSRPSIDATFLSAAVSGIPVKAAALFSGSSPDGAQGMKELAGRGYTTFVQDPAEAESPRMPQEALKICDHTILSREGFSATIKDLFCSYSA